MIQGSAVIEILTETLNGVSMENYYTQGYKDGIKEAIALIEVAESINPLKAVDHVQ